MCAGIEFLTLPLTAPRSCCKFPGFLCSVHSHVFTSVKASWIVW